MQLLQDEWIKICAKYSNDTSLIRNIFEDIIKKYEEKHRHYHNTLHILNLFNHLQKIKHKVKDYDSFFFAIIFHDVIYSTSQKDNEQKSAEYACEKLVTLGFKNIEKVEYLIVKTAKHTQVDPREDYDTQAFLDLDLSILGSSEDDYRKYAQSIRKEWKHVPSFLYKPGRKKVLQKFLEEKYLFRLPESREIYEEKARQNIEQELANL